MRCILMPTGADGDEVAPDRPPFATVVLLPYRADGELFEKIHIVESSRDAPTEREQMKSPLLPFLISA